MNIKSQADVGIIVGRFQTHELREGHLELIKSVIELHPRVIIFLGLSPLRNTINNPLDFRPRQKMINEVFPDVEVYYIEDVSDDIIWSKKLDNQIDKWLNPSQKALLYGSRDSFIEHYHGKFPTCQLEAKVFASGTQIRKEVSTFYPATKDYRAGVIAATSQRYPICYQTIDVAISNDDNEWLMAKKPNESKWRFIGGFSSPESNSLEEDVRREVTEEAGIEVDDIEYISSVKINDWRYANETDCIKTAFFVCKYVFGKPDGSDDVAEVKWFKLGDINKEILVSEHHVLFDTLLDYIKG